MKHYGDITKLSGRTLPVVDVITGGSPCQDLSIAGNRAGLDGERSGLFMEQVRITKEMREEDMKNGRPSHMARPRYLVWENVPGAFSSNKGKDFQAVLEEIVRIAEDDVPDLSTVVRGGGQRADASTPHWESGPLLGAYMTHSFGEYPNEENASRLSQILEDSAHPKYYLSARACDGILRRAERRGKELPKELKKALEEQSASKSAEENLGGAKESLSRLSEQEHCPPSTTSQYGEENHSI